MILQVTEGAAETLNNIFVYIYYCHGDKREITIILTEIVILLLFDHRDLTYLPTFYFRGPRGRLAMPNEPPSLNKDVHLSILIVDEYI